MSGDSSRSDEQGRAEKAVLEQLQHDLLQPGPFERHKKLKVGDANVVVDGYSADPRRLVEVYAHVGKLRGAQSSKIAKDALKLVALQGTQKGSQVILAFIDQKAQPGQGTWLRSVIDAVGIERRVVKVDDEVIKDVEQAQVRQRMINPDGEDELSGDEIPETEADELGVDATPEVEGSDDTRPAE